MTAERGEGRGSVSGMTAKEAFEEAAVIVDKEAARIERIANRHHKRNEYEVYEELEMQCLALGTVADKIRRRAKRIKQAHHTARMDQTP